MRYMKIQKPGSSVGPARMLHGVNFVSMILGIRGTYPQNANISIMSKFTIPPATSALSMAAITMFAKVLVSRKNIQTCRNIVIPREWT